MHLLGRYGGMLSFLVKNKNKSLPPDHAALQVLVRSVCVGGLQWCVNFVFCFFSSIVCVTNIRLRSMNYVSPDTM
jgi:hypothetical protein